MRCARRRADLPGLSMKSILDKSFRYIPAAQTDISKTFARIRKQLAAPQVAKAVTGLDMSGRPAVSASRIRRVA